MGLESIILSNEFRRLDDDSELGETARTLFFRLGRHVKALIAYGSWVYGTNKPDSMRDFLVLVDEPGEFYRENQWVINTVRFSLRTAWAQAMVNSLGPNFYFLDKGKVKIGVIPEQQLEESADSIGNYLGFRLTKPLIVFEVPGGEAYMSNIKQAIGLARIMNLHRTLRLMPAVFTLDCFALKYAGVSYQADVRFEDPRKIATTYKANKEQIDAMCLGYLQNEEAYGTVSIVGGIFTNSTGPASRAREWAYLTFVCKPIFLAQTFRNALTAEDPLGYAARKLIISLQRQS